MAITLTQSEAKSLDGMLTMFGTAAHAAHQCSVQLTALGHYTDRRLERQRMILSKLARLEDKRPDVAATWRETIKRIAKPATTIALECNECGRKYSVGLNNTDPECPKCGGVDYDVRGV